MDRYHGVLFFPKPAPIRPWSKQNPNRHTQRSSQMLDRRIDRYDKIELSDNRGPLSEVGNCSIESLEPRPAAGSLNSSSTNL